MQHDYESRNTNFKMWTKKRGKHKKYGYTLSSDWLSQRFINKSNFLPRFYFLFFEPFGPKPFPDPFMEQDDPLAHDAMKLSLTHRSCGII